jgi:uncharacterized membrane protein
MSIENRGFAIYSVGLAIVLAAPAVGQLYEAVEIPVPPGAETPFPNAQWGLGPDGQVVGSYYINGIHTAFVWDGTDMRFLDGVVPGHRFARDINSSGQVCGSTRLDFPGEIATLWKNNLPLDLGTVPRGGGAGANSINEFGVVAGSVLAPVTGGFRRRAAIFSDGLVEEIMPAQYNGWAYDISDTGFVVGSAAISDIGDPFIWSRSSGFSIINFHGLYGASANSVNRYGHAVGSSASFAGNRAFLYRNGAPEYIFPGFAYGINDGGTVVGVLDRGSDVGAVWRDGAVRDINALVHSNRWNITYCFDINNDGQILASGRIAGRNVGLLLTPVPEVNSFLCVAAMLALASLRRFLASCRSATG